MEREFDSVISDMLDKHLIEFAPDTKQSHGLEKLLSRKNESMIKLQNILISDRKIADFGAAKIEADLELLDHEYFEAEIKKRIN